jgi:hypothetical protein
MVDPSSKDAPGTETQTGGVFKIADLKTTGMKSVS